MIYAYSSRTAVWLAAALWMLAQSVLFHWFIKKLPGRFEEGLGVWGLRVAWWLLLTGVQMGQTAMPFFYNYVLRVILVIVYTMIIGRAGIFLAGYVTFVFFLVKDICKTAVLNVAAPLLGLAVEGDPWLNGMSMAVCAVMQLGILGQVRKFIPMNQPLCLKKTDPAFVFFPVIPYGLVKWFQMDSYTRGTTRDVSTAAVCLMLCVCDLIIFLQTQYWITTQRLREEAEALRVRSQARQERYGLEQENTAEIRRIYHDMKHHLNYIRSLSDNGRIKEYIASITEEMNPLEIFVPTGNEVIDSVLAKSGGDCAREGIRLIPSVHGAVFDFVEPGDLVVMFGNALDNAREAVRKVPEEEKREIVVRADARQNFAVLRVENHFCGRLEYDRAGEIRTTKDHEERHGYGIKNIRLAAGKYQGEVTVAEEDGRFILTVMIPIVDKSEG